MIQSSRPFFNTAALVLAATLAGRAPARATTKGLNQIPTPDIQPVGELSLSLQEVHPQIDNSSQFQLEYGITKRFEIAEVHGFSPGEDRIGAEYGLVQKKPYLLSIGFLNQSSLGAAPQPFIEGGYYKGNEQLMAGSVRAGLSSTELIAGWLHIVNKTVQLSADYQSGTRNFSTAGITFNITLNLIFNPAL